MGFLREDYVVSFCFVFERLLCYFVFVCVITFCYLLYGFTMNMFDLIVIIC